MLRLPTQLDSLVAVACATQSYSSLCKAILQVPVQAILQLPVQSSAAAACKLLSPAPDLDASRPDLFQGWPNIVVGHCLVKAAQNLLHLLEPSLQASLLQHVLQVVAPALQLVAMLGGCYRMRCGCQLLYRVAVLLYGAQGISLEL